MGIKAKAMSEKLEGSLTGDENLSVSGVSSLEDALESDISFLLAEKYIKDVLSSRAKVIISDSVSEITGKTVIKVKNAKTAYIKAMHLLIKKEAVGEYTSKSAVISKNLKRGQNIFIDDLVVIKENTTINDSVHIGAGVVIGKNCTIHKNTIINPNVTLYDNTEIGENNIIHSGTVIGSDGFGYEEDEGILIKVPQIGGVITGNNVEIGSGCTIDRASFSKTVIGNNVKIDNLVHIAHNVKIGDNTIILAQAGIAGSTTIGYGCILGGQVGVADHMNIGNLVKVGSQSGIGKDLPDNSVVSGSPARPLMEERRTRAMARKLGEFFEKIKQMEAEIEKLKEK